jgi:uncharacterized membrane protein YkgB
MRFFLRVSLALVFCWFGALKMANLTPDLDFLRHCFPILATAPYLQLLGAAELLIAIGLLWPRWHRLASALLVLHLIGSLSVVVVSPGLIFGPAFPRLTMEGEFVATDLVLISWGLVSLLRPPERPRSRLTRLIVLNETGNNSPGNGGSAGQATTNGHC